LQGKVCGGNDSPQRQHLPRTASRHGNLLPLSGQYLSHSEGLGDELEGKKQQGRSKAAALSTAATGILAPPETSSTPRSSEPPGDLSAGYVSGFANKLARFHRPPEAGPGLNFSLVFRPDLSEFESLCSLAAGILRHIACEGLTIRKQKIDGLCLW
jgi:hypothetical protein